jgi:hypothetical protein
MGMHRSEMPWTLDFYRGLVQGWNAYWFTPRSSKINGWVRIALGMVMTVQFVLHFGWVPNWLTSDGWLDRSVGLYLIGDGMEGTGSDYRWSLLYGWGNAAVAWAICLVGLLSSLGMVVGIGGRWIVLCVWGCVMMIHQRAPWLTLPAETLQSAALLYLAIAPGVGMRLGTKGVKAANHENEQGKSVLANVGLRCLQVHWILWLFLSTANMLQQEAWWTGQAVGVLSEQGAGLLGLVPRESQWGQVYSLGILGSQLATALFLVNPGTWRFAVLSTILLGTLLVLVAGQWILAAMGLVFLVAFLGNAGPSDGVP